MSELFSVCAHIAGQIALLFSFFSSRYSTDTCNLAPVLFSVCYFVRVGTGFPGFCIRVVSVEDNEQVR